MSFQVEAKVGARDGERAAEFYGRLVALCRELDVSLNEFHSHPIPKLTLAPEVVELPLGGGGEDGSAA